MILFNYLLVCLIFGTTFLAIKVGINASSPPFFSAGLRFLVAGLVLLLWMVWRKKASFALLLRKEMLLTGLGLTFGTFSMLYWAEQHVSSGIAAVLSATGPLMIMLIQMSVLGEKTTVRSALGCIIGFAGVILLMLSDLSISSAADHWWLMRGIAILIGEICYASGALYSQRVIQRLPNVSPIALNAAQMIYGGLLLLLLSLFTEQVHIKQMLDPNAMGSLLYLIIVGSMAGHSIFYWLVAKTNPVFPSTWLYVSPIIAMATGSILYHETVTWVSIIGMITIIGGTIVTNLDKISQLMHVNKKA